MRLALILALLLIIVPAAGYSTTIYVPDSFPDWNHYRGVWEGEEEDAYGLTATVGTIALVLLSMAVEKDYEQAHLHAEKLWHDRHAPSADTEQSAIA